MASKSKAAQATFQGVIKGRPRFDWGDDLAPPDWLVKLSNKGSVLADQFILSGKPLAVGGRVSGG